MSTQASATGNPALIRTITVTVNGAALTRSVPTRKTLADFIREDLG